MTQKARNYVPWWFENDPTPATPSEDYAIDADQVNRNIEDLALSVGKRTIKSNDATYLAEGSVNYGNSKLTAARWTVLLAGFFELGDRLQISINYGGTLYVWRTSISQDCGGARKAEIELKDYDAVPTFPTGLIENLMNPPGIKVFPDYRLLLGLNATITLIGKGDGSTAGHDLSSCVYGLDDIYPGSVETAHLQDDIITTPKILALNVTEPKIAAAAISQTKLNSANIYPQVVCGTFGTGLSTNDYTAIGGDSSEDAYIVPESGQLWRLGVRWGGSRNRRVNNLAANVYGNDPSIGLGEKVQIEVYINGAPSGLFVLWAAAEIYTVATTGLAIPLSAGDRLQFCITNTGTATLGDYHLCTAEFMMKIGNVL